MAYTTMTNRAIVGDMQVAEFAVEEPDQAENILRDLTHYGPDHRLTAYEFKLETEDQRGVLFLSSPDDNRHVRVTQLSGHSYVVDFGNEEADSIGARTVQKLLKVLEGLGSPKAQFIDGEEFDALIGKLRSEVRQRPIFKF